MFPLRVQASLPWSLPCAHKIKASNSMMQFLLGNRYWLKTKLVSRDVGNIDRKVCHSLISMFCGELITDIFHRLPKLWRRAGRCFPAVEKLYRKNSKIWDTSNNCHNCPKNRNVWCNTALMDPKDADGMANSVDLDQTASSEAVWSWSALLLRPICPNT